MRKILILGIVIPFFGVAQQTLSIDVQGVRNSEGSISYAVYTESKGFLKVDKVYRSDSIKAVQGTTHLVINNLPKGNYAFAVFHDENSNALLDTNWLGIPREAIGFSNARMKTFGPPTFEECSISVLKNSSIVVLLE